MKRKTPAAKPEKGKAGRPRWEPEPKDYKLVESLVGFGISQMEICSLLGISPPTLRQYFWKEIEIGGTKANSNVAESLYKRALDLKHPQGASCAIFWMKCRAGWRDVAEPPKGKKEMLNERAREGAREGEWGDILN